MHTWRERRLQNLLFCRDSPTLVHQRLHLIPPSDLLSSSLLTSFISVSPSRSPSARPRQLVARSCGPVSAERTYNGPICLAKSNHKAKVSTVFCIAASGHVTQIAAACFVVTTGIFIYIYLIRLFESILIYLIRLYLVNLTIPMIFLLPSVSCETRCIVDEFIYF